MTVHALVPVFNRLACTREVVRCLRAQQGADLRIVVIDDGSTDKTADYLRGEPDILALHGDGALWWAGAIHLAQQRLLPELNDDDYLLLVNNDTTFDPDYVATLVATSRKYGGAVVGSALRDEHPPHQLLSIGPMLDVAQMRVWDRLADLPEVERELPLAVYPVDALPGRGSLYPAPVVRAIGLMRPRWLPHYHADYEYAARALRQGFPLLVSTAAVVYTGLEFGNDSSRFSFFERHFSTRSAANIRHRIAFYLLVGTWQERIMSIPRMIWHTLARWTKRPVYGALHWVVRYVAASKYKKGKSPKAGC